MPSTTEHPDCTQLPPPPLHHRSSHVSHRGLGNSTFPTFPHKWIIYGASLGPMTLRRGLTYWAPLRITQMKLIEFTGLQVSQWVTSKTIGTPCAVSTSSLLKKQFFNKPGSVAHLPNWPTTTVPLPQPPRIRCPNIPDRRPDPQEDPYSR